jgi:PAS domain S-box-containing protein
MQGSPLGEAPRRAFAENGAMPLWDGVGLALGVGIAYFLGARLSLALLTKPDGVAVFWPAAGISAGFLIASGPRARLPVAIGVMAATVSANLLGDRNLAATAVFALCNAGEAILIAWLIGHHFGLCFSLDSVRNVLGLFAAATLATAVSGVGGTVGFALFHNSGTPFLTTWLNWLASDALGVLTVAPLVIGLAGVLRNRPGKSEAAEGLLLLAVLALASGVGFVWPTGHWFTILPGTLTLPLLLWLTARCRPVFAAASVFIPALAIVCAITFGIGRLGNPSIPLVNRVHAAQAALLALSLCTLVLAAVFAERRAHVAALKDSNRRLQLALDCAELGTWSFHLKTGLFENDVRDRRIHGHGLQLQTLGQMRSQVHPEDLANLDGAFLSLGRVDGSCRAEYRLAPRINKEHNGRERWVALQGGVVRDTGGHPAQLLGVTRDITERKHAEARLQESERALRELLGALPAAIYVTDMAGRITYCNEGAINLWGARPKLGEDRWSDFSRLYHADGRPMTLEDCPTQMALVQGRAVRGREAILERADGLRIPIIPYPTPLRDATGAIIGVVNMTVDISERKKAEQALAERNAQLALAGRAALVGSYAYDVSTEEMQISEGYAAIHGLPERTTETALTQWRERVHPEDLGRVEGFRDQIFANRRKEYTLEYRIIRPDGEVRWIERRSSISYGGDGRPERVIGVTIDVTGRKRAEERQRILVAELDHRVKNALATVSSVISQSAVGSGSVANFVAALDGRIRSMATTHELLSSSSWQGISLAELVRRELAPYATGHNSETKGPEVVLRPEAGQATALVLHELATNAAKYGALSTKDGRVSIRWHRRMNGQPRSSLVLEWQEMDGPPIVATGKPSYGTSTIRELIPYEFGGTVDLVLAPDGVRCRLELPADWVI